MYAAHQRTGEGLRSLKKTGIDLTLVAASERWETEHLIERVAGGEVPLTVADSHILQVEQTYGQPVAAGPRLQEEAEPKALAFAMRPTSKELHAYVNRFIKKTYRGLSYNLFRKRYFENPKKIRAFKGARVDRSKTLSPYDGLMQKYARKYGFDWRLLAAQAYVESGFDPNAQSWVGAQGLFQVMPATGRSMGFTNLQDPEIGTQAGAQYLSRMVARFDPQLPFRERLWFALAAYNAGLGHVHDARRLAKKKGWNADQWFGGVERAMKLLAQRKYARSARHGYCRGGEPVAYVRSIRDLYLAYQEVLSGEKPEDG